MHTSHALIRTGSHLVPIDFQNADNIISVSCLNQERGVEGGGGIVQGGKRHGGQLSRG